MDPMMPVRPCLLALTIVVAAGCGSAATQTSSAARSTSTPAISTSPVTFDCPAPMDPASPSLAGTAPAWITFDRSSLGPRNTAQVATEPIGILVVLDDQVQSVRFYVVDAVGRRLIISPQAGPAVPVDELNLRQDQAQLDRGSVWLTRIAVRFAEAGCYHGVFEGLAGGPRKVQIRIDP